MAWFGHRQLLRASLPFALVVLSLSLWEFQRFLQNSTLPTEASSEKLHTTFSHSSLALRPSSPANGPRFTRKVLDVCSHRRYSCLPGKHGKVGYCVYISNSSGYAVPRRGRDVDDVLTYFDYIYALVSKLVSVTSFPVVILVTSEVAATHRTQWTSISPGQVEVREILPGYTSIDGLEATRTYHYFSFGKLEVLNPRWVGDFSKLIVFDPDTFALKCVDEAFCLPGKFAAVRRAHAPTSRFNAGFMVVSPNRRDYSNIFQMLQVRARKERIFGDQPLFNQYFFSQMSCLGAEYNCGGFADVEGIESLKCGIPSGSDERYLLTNRSVLHLKMSQRKIFERLPIISKEWRSHLPLSSQESANKRVFHTTYV